LLKPQLRHLAENGDAVDARFVLSIAHSLEGREPAFELI
jgi:hypothetical protein